MKYLCLIYEDETLWQKMPKAEADKLYAEYSAFKDDIKNSGHLVGCHPLQPTHAATTVRVRNGRVSTTDGPFAETKELVAGYTIIQVKSREEALEWTKRFPNPAIGGKECEIEVRQLFELEDFGPSEAIERFRDMGIGERK